MVLGRRTTCSRKPAPPEAPRHGHRPASSYRSGPPRPHVRVRHHAVRRHASRARRDLPRLRPRVPVVAGRGARGALRAERHRHRRPVAGAGRAGRRRLDRAGPAGDRAFPRGHGSPAGAAAAGVRRRGGVDPRDRRGDRETAGERRRVPRGRSGVPGRLLRSLLHRPVRLRVGLRRGDHARALPRAWRRSRPTGQARPARRPAVAG